MKMRRQADFWSRNQNEKNIRVRENENTKNETE